jgi:hypothetical protein
VLARLEVIDAEIRSSQRGASEPASHHNDALGSERSSCDSLLLVAPGRDGWGSRGRENSRP